MKFSKITIGLFGLICLICTYSYYKFETLNIVDVICGISSLKQENPTHALKDNVILIKYEFKNSYINYLTQIYNEKEWKLNKKENNIYQYCNNELCDIYEIKEQKILFKKYVILVQK